MRQLLPQSFYVIFCFTVIAFMGMIQACQTIGLEQFSKVQNEMNKDEVLDILGSPNRTERFDGKEKWAYRYFSPDNKEELRQVTFVNGRVVSVGEDGDELKRIKEIQEGDQKRMERRKAAHQKTPASSNPAPVDSSATASQPAVEAVEEVRPDPQTVEYKEVKGQRGSVGNSQE